MNTDYIKIVSDFEKDWIGIASTYVGEADSSEAVQNMYIKIGKHADGRIIKEDGDLNRSYVFLTLRSCCFDILKNRNRYNNDRDVEHYDSENFGEYTDKQRAFDVLISNIETYADVNWTWYDRTLFKLYKDTPFSLRGLAQETGISWMSIHATIKRLKDEIKEQFSEDWEDYINEDYELIKPLKK